MNIGFNLLPYTFGTHGGAEVYLRNTVSSLCKGNKHHQIYLFGESVTYNQVSPQENNRIHINIPNYWQSSRPIRLAAEQTVLPFLCIKHKIDCLISNYVVPVAAPCKNIVIVHDMLYRRYPAVFEQSKLLYWQTMIPASIRRSSGVVTVSQFSADEIKHFYPAAQKKLFVTVEGIRPSLLNNTLVQTIGNGFSKEYLLCIATFGKHKNLHTLVKAFVALTEIYKEVDLLLVGAARTPDARKYQAELKQFIAKAGIASRVIFTDHVTDQELAHLYKNAIACVLPSLYEGFGLPVIEAQYFGCPVVCSNKASLPEIAGGAALHFNAEHVESVRESLTKIITQPSIRQQLREAGYKNVTNYTWDNAASQLMQAIEYVTHTPNRYAK